MDTLKSELAKMLDSPVFAAARSQLLALDNQAEKFTSKIATGSIAWRKWGRGPHIVLLHGAYGSWRHWIRNVATLASAFTVWAPDIPGHGDSELFDRSNRPMDGVGAALMEDLRARIGRDLLHLVGFSYGGRLIADMATHDPANLGSVSLVGAMGFGSASTPMPQSRSWRHIISLGSMIAAQKFNLGAIMIHEHSMIDQLAIYVQMVNTFLTRITPTVPEPGEHWGRFSNLKVPIGILWGEQDVYHRGLFSQRLAYVGSQVAAARVRLVPKAGHWVMYERPDAFSAFIKENLSLEDSNGKQAEWQGR